jgi:hypothetical protein
MIATPSALQSKFEEHLRNKAIPGKLHGMYQKWLRYYLDFCQKYHVPPKHVRACPPPFHRKIAGQTAITGPTGTGLKSGQSVLRTP